MPLSTTITPSNQRPSVRSAPRRRVALGVLAVVALSCAAVVGTSPQEARAASGSSRAQADYALDTFGDAWDFSNPEDFDVTPDVQSAGVHNLAMTGGQLHGDADPGGKV